MSRPAKLDQNYWNGLYETGDYGWDIGHVSTPLKEYIDQLEDKNIAILIPGCGNAYEAEYLLQKGFTDVTVVDISKIAAETVKEKLKDYGPKLKVVFGDFFELHQKFDLILEQTFFCALDPGLRRKYAEKMYDLLKQNGKLVGLYFDRTFDDNPPFGGNRNEYVDLFADLFDIVVMERAFNSIEKRAGSELFAILKKRA